MSEWKAEWQPIETAPKDTWILVHDKGESNPCVAKFSTIGAGWWTADHSFVQASGGWDGAVVEDAIFPQYLTHWMPLPSPPKSDK